MVHLQDNGFTVETHDVPSWEALAVIRRENGVPDELAGCHTAVVDGYVVEGHVPAREIHRLRADRPTVTGLVVPGMPAGSPGMEGPPPERYNVLTFDRAGRVEIFERY